MEISVQRALLEQATDLCALVEEYYEAVSVVVRDTEAQRLEYLGNPKHGAWLAYWQRRPVGCILYHPLPEMHRAGEVKRLYVRPTFRRVGIAQLLLNNVEQFAIEQGIQYLYLDTNDTLQAAIAFYERNGYSHCPRYNDNPQATIFMRKRLG